VSAPSQPNYSTAVAEEHPDLATEPKRSDDSLSDLLSELTGELSTLFRQEIELAKTEAQEQATIAGKAGAMFGGAALAAWLALVLLSLAAAWLLDDALNRALSFAIVGVLWAVAAFVLQRSARSKLSALRGLSNTKQTIQEDMEWAKAQKN
jgi:uncharacterized membrane protein YqjE